VKPLPGGKAKRLNFKRFQTGVVKVGPIWNESKQSVTAGLWAWSQTVFSASAAVCRQGCAPADRADGNP
jgi:hypothetical protein